MTDSVLPYDGTVLLALSVSDRTASAEWYAKQLGFELLYDAAEIGWCEMALPIQGVMLGLADQDGVRIGGPVPTLGVTDLDSARATLEGADVSFDGETVVHEGMVKLATFFDPDGHAWMMAESLVQPEGS